MRLLKCTCDDNLEICDCENANDIFCKNEASGQDRCDNIVECDICEEL